MSNTSDTINLEDLKLYKSMGTPVAWYGKQFASYYEHGGWSCEVNIRPTAAEFLGGMARMGIASSEYSEQYRSVVRYITDGANFFTADELDIVEQHCSKARRNLDMLMRNHEGMYTAKQAGVIRAGITRVEKQVANAKRVIELVQTPEAEAILNPPPRPPMVEMLPPGNRRHFKQVPAWGVFV